MNADIDAILREMADMRRRLTHLESAAVPDQNTSSSSDVIFSSINLDTATGTTDGQLRIYRDGTNQPAIILGRTAEAADEKYWRLLMPQSKNLRLGTLSDDALSGSTLIDFTRGTGVGLGAMTIFSGVNLGTATGATVGGDIRTSGSAAFGSLTSGRIPFTGASGLLKDSTSLTTDGANVTASALYLGNQANAALIMKDLNAMTNGAASQVGSTAGVIAVIDVINSTDGTMARFNLQGGLNSTQEVSDPSAKFSTASGTATSANVYWSGARSRYELENNLGGTKNFRVFEFRNG